MPGIGGARAVLLTTFKERDQKPDLFGEGSTLGGVTELMKAVSTPWWKLATSLRAPIECLHEMKLIIDLVVQGGRLSFMRYSVSDTGIRRLHGRKRIINGLSQSRNAKSSVEIQDGTFARNWILRIKPIARTSTR